MITTVRIRQKRLGSIGRPFDRTVDAFTRPHEDRFFGVHKNLRAKTTADVWSNHTQFMLGYAQHKRAHQQSLNVRVLVRDIQRIALAGAVVSCVRRARLHRIWREALIDKLQRADVMRLFERSFHARFVTMSPRVANVVRCLIMHRSFA